MKLEHCKLVADVVWKHIVSHAVLQAPPRNIVRFMLVGLSREVLEGIARNAPDNVRGRSMLLRMHPLAVSELNVDTAFLSEESAVHWRHSKEAEVIVFAPTDADRRAAGATLASVSRIDETRIVGQISAWRELLNDSGPADEYLNFALKGLRSAHAYIDLQMWAEFVTEIRDQDFERPVDLRIKAAMPALRIPKDGIPKLPSFNRDGNPNAKTGNFAAAFKDAKKVAGGYVGLMTPKNEPVDLEAVRINIEEFQHGGDSEILESLNVARALLEDAENIRPGYWEESQETFCRKVSWEKVGSNIFEGRRRSSSLRLGERTLLYINEEYSDQFTQEDEDLLKSMSSTAPLEPREDEVEFFYKWQERIALQTKLYKAWQKRLYSKEVIGYDLLSAFAGGFEALMNAGSGAATNTEDPCILVRATQHNKAHFWKSLDGEVLQLFQFELKSVKGVFSNRVCWDLEFALKYDSDKVTSAREARKVDLEMFLVERGKFPAPGNADKPPPSALRVISTWQPGRSPRVEPTSLSLVNDIEALAKAANSGKSVFRALKFAPRLDSDNSGTVSTELADRNSFSDVSQGQQGRTFDIAEKSDENLLADLLTKLSELERNHALDADAAQRTRDAITDFENKFRVAVEQLAEDPSKAFASTILEQQARAFGTLCHACRLPASSGQIGEEIRSLVSRIGFVSSDRSEPMAILAAWHPLRLAERQAKLQELAEFVEKVLSSSSAVEADLSVAFEERRFAQSRWVFPEVAMIEGTLMISVEDLFGYSLMVPADQVARNQESLEASASKAAKRFMEGVDQYLETHPHEETNLSVAIFDSESRTLPSEIAREMAKRLHNKPDLRCDLVITHSDQARMRNIYRSQNVRLAAENINETARGFLSGLRVDVRPNFAESTSSEGIPNMDLVLLHDVISHHATPAWEVEKGCSQSLESRFDATISRLPRRRMTETDSFGAGVYLNAPRLPRAVAEYQDLLYELSRGYLPKGFRGVLVRQARFADPTLLDIIERAHRLGEWVITYDKVASRALLERHDVQIISDVTKPGSDGRVIISAGNIDAGLKRNIREDLLKSCAVSAIEADNLADSVIRDVLGISGQKMLSAARYSNASREMIGLAVMRSWMEAALKDSNVSFQPVWISLDDYRGWFLRERGKVADAIALAIEDNGDEFRVCMLVGEAKFVGLDSEQTALNDAKQQVRDSTARLSTLFIDNDDEISRGAWCSRLADILINREDIARSLADSERRTMFVDALNSGKVTFRVAGEAVVCLHDLHKVKARTEHDQDNSYLRHHVLAAPDICRTLKCSTEGQFPESKSNGIGGIRWKEGGSSGSNSFAQNIPFGEHHDSTADTQVTNVIVAGRDREFSIPSEETEAPTPESGIADDNTLRGSAMLLETDEGQSQELEAPQFLPRPVYQSLRELASRESDALGDDESWSWAEETAMKLQRALSHFNMQAQFSEPKLRLIPNGVLIAFCGHSTLTAEKIERRKGELLTTNGIEIADIRPSPGRISIFVKRDKRAKVPLASTWLRAQWPDAEPGVCTNLIIGAREDDDRLLYLNIAGKYAGYEEHGPHTLIAGETGSGKGVLTQGILLQLIAFNDPGEAELILIDPKMGVDFGWLEGTPHLKSGIVTDIDEAKGIFEALVQKMDERYKMFKSAGTANIAEYNLGASPEARISRIFLIHDELGAWMAQEKEYQEVVLSSVANLGMKARAAGIHLILITQRADADAVPGRLRDNMGNRLCLKVQNSTGSRMVLSVGGAERLLGKGHLACVLANEPNPAGQEFFVAQTPFAETENIRRLAQAAKDYWKSRAD